MIDRQGIFKGILGGIAIGLGCIGYVGCDNRVAGAFIFSLGLLVILTFNWKLFTGSICKRIIWTYKGKSIAKPICVTLLCTYISNFVGILMMALLYAVKSWGNLEGVRTIAAKKLAAGHFSRIFSGVLCEVCIFIAVYAFKELKSELRKSLIVVMSVMAFILSGGEHCIADMFFMIFSGSFFGSLLFIIEVTLGNVLGAFVIKRFNEKCY